MFTLANINLHYPYTVVERVPVGKNLLINAKLWWLTAIAWNIIYAGVIPFIVLCLWLAISRSTAHKAQVTLLGFFIA
jgi:diacylglycerol diphosphate phosphatase / phosphatidate phosphatase